MDWLSLVPSPDSIPAPWWVFEALDVVTFTVHLLFMNVVLGGSILLLVSRLKGGELRENLHGALAGKIPSAIALAVNFGVAPLLFVQVLYGHLIYSSSILMGVYWILVIPFLIVAYYGAYIYARRHNLPGALSPVSLAVSTAILLYIAFMLVNNMTLLLQPEKWTAYLSNRGGTALNLGDPMLWPRYLHFVTAAIAVAGLFTAVVWSRRRTPVAEREARVRFGLMVFAVATAMQVFFGLWFLAAIPSELRMAFMGGNMLYAAVLMIGIMLGLAAMMAALMGKLAPTVGLLLGTLVAMVLNRAFLRSAYLERFFSVESLKLAPQYGVMALFFAVFAAGAVVVGYVLKVACAAGRKEVAE